MLKNTYYLHQIKRTNGVIEKGIVVKDSAETAKGNLDAAQQSMYAYLGAYGYGKQANTDYVLCMITDYCGNIVVQPVYWWADSVIPELIDQPEEPEQTEPEETEGGEEA